MYGSVSLWASAEGGVLGLRAHLLVDKMNWILSTAAMASILYWFGFVMLIISINSILGDKSAFIAWAIMGVIFEMITLILVSHRISKDVFKDPVNLFLLVFANILIVILAVVMNVLYARFTSN